MIKIILTYLIIATSLVFGQVTEKRIKDLKINEIVAVFAEGYTFSDALVAGADTSHYSFIEWVLFLQDSLDDKLNRSEYSPSGFDTTFVYQAISLKLAKLDFDDSLYAYVAATLGDDDSIATGSTVIAYLAGQNYITATILNDSNYVLTSEAGAWDKDSTNDMLASAFDDSVDHYIDNTAYNATTWDGDTIKAPSKNAVRDKIEAVETEISGKANSVHNHIIATNILADEYIIQAGATWEEIMNVTLSGGLSSSPIQVMVSMMALEKNAADAQFDARILINGTEFSIGTIYLFDGTYGTLNLLGLREDASDSDVISVEVRRLADDRVLANYDTTAPTMMVVSQ